ncbi:MAG: transporter substrate-binding domain-containing protein [Cyanobacteria bacterium P01_C01_bin.69]
MKSFLTQLILRLTLIGGAQLLLPPIFVPFVGVPSSELRVQAAELSEIRDRGYITVGVKSNRSPLGFVDANGSLAGFEIDIAERLAEVLLGDRTAVKLVPVANVDRLSALLEGDVDIAIAALTITPARRRLISFSDPYYLDGAAFITQQSHLQTLRDLALAKIALLEGSSTVPRVRYVLPGASLFGVSSYQEGQALLAEGAVDAFAGDVSVLAGWTVAGFETDDVSADGVGADGVEYRILPSIISAEPLAIAMPKGTQYHSLKSEINQALRHWYEEGWLQARAAYWGLPSEATQFIDLSPAFQPTDALAN